MLCLQTIATPLMYADVCNHLFIVARHFVRTTYWETAVKHSGDDFAKSHSRRTAFDRFYSPPFCFRRALKWHIVTEL